MNFRTTTLALLMAAVPGFALAQQSVPVDLGVAAPIMLNRDHNGGCDIAKDTKFKAQLDFASAANVTAARPWEAIDFTTDPEAYMQAVLNAALADNDAIEWDIGNKPNGWVHASWMAQDRELYGILLSSFSPRQNQFRCLGEILQLGSVETSLSANSSSFG
ncbi:MAG: hypothetical protein ABJ327_25430 [Litoreibacter sp.]